MTPRISFNLRKTPNTKKAHIQLVVAFSFKDVCSSTGNRKYRYLRLNTGLQISPDYWDKQSMRPSAEFSAKDGMKMHLKIDKQQQLMQRSIDALIESSSDDEITTERLKEVFEMKSGKSKTTLKKVSVLEDTQHWVEHGDCSELTRASYNALALTLDEYEEYYSTELFWHQFTQKEFDSVLNFLQPKKLKNNTI